MDAKDVGQGKTYPEAVEKYDAEHGKYDCEKNHPPAVSPKASANTGAAASPFTLGGNASKK